MESFATAQAATVQWDEGTTWVVGGYDGYNSAQESYFMKASGLFEDGDDFRKIPEAMQNHCMAKIDANTYVKVGTDKVTHDTWIYRHDAPQGADRWIPGPALIDKHNYFDDVKCGKILTGKAFLSGTSDAS